jgi:enoyl-[acyl-carrier-protein] reductase (NADH)
VRTAASYLPDGGRIIAIGSGLGYTVPVPGAADYSATKSALHSYTHGWARDFGPKGITMNLVMPGLTDTDLAAGRMDMCKTDPIARAGRPEEVAAVVLFLATPAAGYITGTPILVDGGGCAQKVRLTSSSHRDRSPQLSALSALATSSIPHCDAMPLHVSSIRLHSSSTVAPVARELL